MKTANKRQVQQQGVDNLMAGRKKPYLAPQLTAWGKVRSVTLGGSTGQLDSGDSTAKKVSGPPGSP
jgi:hypothetical protein